MGLIPRANAHLTPCIPCSPPWSLCSLVGTARENYYHKASKTQTCAGRKVHEKPSGDWTPESDLFGWCVGVPNQLPGNKVIIGLGWEDPLEKE